MEENSKFYGEMYFWDYGVGREREKGERIGFLGKRWKEKEGIWVIYGKGCNMEYSLMECFL